MTAATFHSPRSFSGVRPARKESPLARFFNAIAEARTRAAMREIAMHRHLIPEDMLKKNGYVASLGDDSAFPFTR